MSDKETALVTGANKGIGRQIARRLAAEGLVVYLGSRDLARGREAAEGLDGDVRPIELDVTDEAQIRAAAERVTQERGSLSVLVNNAGIAVEWGTPIAEVSAEQTRRTFEVNVFGVVAVTRAFVPLLRRSAEVRPGARIVNLSSPLGSLQLLSDPHSRIVEHALLAYSSSKSAVNALTLVYAHALRADGILVNAVSPGYVATDLNGHRGLLSVEQGAEAPLRLALLGPDGPTGTFTEIDGAVPW
jgi:NAD(P)-dependent dehydrogenase (short-subunit alcohol dehydrogenase family)